jgi:hypothetical protein
VSVDQPPSVTIASVDLSHPDCLAAPLLSASTWRRSTRVFDVIRVAIGKYLHAS